MEEKNEEQSTKDGGEKKLILEKEDEDKRQLNKLIYSLMAFVFIGLTAFCFATIPSLIPVEVVGIVGSLLCLYGVIRRTTLYEKFKLEKIEKSKKVNSAISTVVLVIVVLALLVGVVTCASYKPQSSYEPSTHDVLKWYDEKDKDGNYVNRGEYNQKRSY